MTYFDRVMAALERRVTTEITMETHSSNLTQELAESQQVIQIKEVWGHAMNNYEITWVDLWHCTEV